jgi:hypothetical protein
MIARCARLFQSCTDEVQPIPSKYKLSETKKHCGKRNQFVYLKQLQVITQARVAQEVLTQSRRVRATQPTGLKEVSGRMSLRNFSPFANGP